MSLRMFWSWHLFPLGMVQEELCLLGHPRTWQGELIFFHCCWLAFPDAASQIASNPFPCRFLHWDDCMAWGWGEVSSCLDNLGAALHQPLLTSPLHSASLEVSRKCVDMDLGTNFSEAPGSPWLVIGLDDLRELFQP